MLGGWYILVILSLIFNAVCLVCGYGRRNGSIGQLRGKIPKDVREDLQEWEEALPMLDTRRIIPDITPIDLNWVRDASLKGIGVLIGGKKWAQFALIKGLNLGLSNGVVQNIAWAETVTILLGLIIISQRHNVGGKHYIVLTGNTMSQSVVGKRQSRDQAVNME